MFMFSELGAYNALFLNSTTGIVNFYEELRWELEKYKYL